MAVLAIENGVAHVSVESDSVSAVFSLSQREVKKLVKILSDALEKM